MTHWFAIDEHQIDHFHLRLAIRRVVTTDHAAARRWWSHLRSGGFDLIEAAAQRGVSSGRYEAEAVREVLHYLEASLGRIDAAARLRVRGAPSELCDRGSGAIEHAVEQVINRRMKRKGMFWSTEGAENMLALRSLAVDPVRWREVIGAPLVA